MIIAFWETSGRRGKEMKMENPKNVFRKEAQSCSGEANANINEHGANLRHSRETKWVKRGKRWKTVVPCWKKVCFAVSGAEGGYK